MAWFARGVTTYPPARFEYLIQTTWFTGGMGGKVVYLNELRLKSSRIRGYGVAVWRVLALSDGLNAEGCWFARLGARLAALMFTL